MSPAATARRGGLVLASVLVIVTILATLICALAQVRQACDLRRRAAARRLVAMHLAEGLAEEGVTAPRSEVPIPARPLTTMGSLRTDLARLGTDPAACLPRGLTVERSLRRWRGMDAVVVVVTWPDERRRRRLRFSLPRRDMVP